MITVLQTTWQKAVVVRIRARRVFVLDAVLANLSLVALPRTLGLDPDRRISQYGHPCVAHPEWRHLPPTNTAQTVRLAMSRSIVESHGDRLWARANNGRGAPFHFTLPTRVTESSPLVA
jgi:hypothetical protein